MNGNEKHRLVCPQCHHLFPALRYIYQSKDNKVMIHLNCSQCLDRVYNYEDYITLTKTITVLPPYTSHCSHCLSELNNSIGSFVYCSKCSLSFCERCANDHLIHPIEPISPFSLLQQTFSSKKAHLFSQIALSKQTAEKLYISQISIINDIIANLHKLTAKLKTFLDDQVKFLSQYESIFNLIFDSFDALQEKDWNFNVYEMLNKLSSNTVSPNAAFPINTLLNNIKETVQKTQSGIESLFYETIVKSLSINYSIKEPLIHTIPTECNKVISSIIQASNGNLISAQGNCIAIWDSSLFKLQRTVKPLSTTITSLCELLPSKQLSACSVYQSIAIINLTTYETVTILDYHSNITWDFIRLSLGLYASCSGDKTILILDSKLNGIKLEIKAHKEAIRRVIESKDGSVISCSWDKTISKWNVTTGECLMTLKENDYSYPLDIIEIDCNFLISCGSNGAVKKWNMRLEKVVGNLSVHCSKIWKMCLLKDGSIATCSRDYHIAIVDVTEMVVVSNYWLTSNKKFKCIVQLSDGRLVSGDKEGLIKVWKQ